jgi:hypothetical protein
VDEKMNRCTPNFEIDSSIFLVASKFTSMIIILCYPLLVEGFGGCSVINGGEKVMDPGLLIVYLGL